MLENLEKLAGAILNAGGVNCVYVASPKQARLHLVEQAHVLDRDHRLVGEGGDQLDLFFGERLHNGSGDDNHPTGLPSRKSGTPKTVR